MKKEVLIITILVLAACTHSQERVLQIGQGTAGWSWHQRPAAVHFQGEQDKTYVGTVSNKGEVIITSFDHRSKEIRQNELYVYAINEGGGDDHNSPTILVRNSDKRIIVFWTGHGSQTIYWAVSEQPEDISTFGEINSLSDPVGTYTYTQPVELVSENKIYLFTRRNHEGLPGVFVWDINVSTDNGETFRRDKNPLWYETDTRSPYTEVYSNNVDTIWFLRSDSLFEQPSYVRKYLTFCYYHKGAFYKADGTRIIDYQDLPITNRKNLDLIYDSDSQGDTGYVYSKDLGLDAQGNPVVVFTTMDKNRISHYWYGKWDGETWKISYIAETGQSITEIDTQPAYDAGIALNHENANEIYLGREEPSGSNNFQIEQWRTNDEGVRWVKVKEFKSKSYLKNFRPYVPLNHSSDLEVLWIAGPKYYQYNDFETYLFGLFKN